MANRPDYTTFDQITNLVVVKGPIMQDTLNEFSTEVEGQRYLNPEVFTQEGNEFIQNLRNTQTQHNAEIQQTSDQLGTYPATQSNLGGLGGNSYFERSFQTAPSVSLAAQIRSNNQRIAFEQALKNDLDYWGKLYDKKLKEKRRQTLAAMNLGGGNGGPSDVGIDTIVPGNETIDYSPASNKGAGYLNLDERGTYYVSTDGTKRYNLRDWDANGQDMFSGISVFPGKNQASGDVINGQNKVQYLYYPGAQSAGGGDYYPIVSIEDL